MQVTCEMVDSLWHGIGFAVSREEVERSLRATLADVPEPLSTDEAVGLGHTIDAQDRRIAELEGAKDALELLLARDQPSALAVAKECEKRLAHIRKLEAQLAAVREAVAEMRERESPYAEAAWVWADRLQAALGDKP